MKRRKVCIRGMYGLGDSIYQRAFVRQFPGAFLRTPWPELYNDLNVKFIRSNTSLRTQRKNEEQTEVEFVQEPSRPSEILTIFYGPDELSKGSIIDAMTWQFGRMASVFDLPSFGESPVQVDKPIAVNNYMTEVLDKRRSWTRYVLSRELRKSLRPQRRKKK